MERYEPSPPFAGEDPDDLGWAATLNEAATKLADLRSRTANAEGELERHERRLEEAGYFMAQKAAQDVERFGRLTPAERKQLAAQLASLAPLVQADLVGGFNQLTHSLKRGWDDDDAPGATQTKKPETVNVLAALEAYLKPLTGLATRCENQRTSLESMRRYATELEGKIAQPFTPQKQPIICHRRSRS